MTRVSFSDVERDCRICLTYSIIVARYGNKWLIVRHCRRKTWEIPGGHIEPGEEPGEAARRELIEETGAVKYFIRPVSVYSVTRDGKTGYGMLYFAEIHALGPLFAGSEICRVRAVEKLPSNLTYPDIQPVLFQKVLEWLESEGRD
jgi:8-oxo-dGTP diphosphatase